MKAFHVGWKSSSMFGIDLHLIMAEPCLVRLTFRYHHGSICFHPSCQSCHYVQVSSSALQLTPSASHAASTSGLPCLRYTFSLRNEPLNLITLYERSIWSRSGAIMFISRAWCLPGMNLLFCDTRAVHSKFLSSKKCCPRSTTVTSAKQTFKAKLTTTGHLELADSLCSISLSESGRRASSSSSAEPPSRRSFIFARWASFT
jgi:hypothetical protein